MKQLTIIVSLGTVLAGYTSTASYGMEASQDDCNWTASYPTLKGTITHQPTRIKVDFENTERQETPNGFSYKFSSGSASFIKIPFVEGKELPIPGFAPKETMTLTPQSKQSDFEDALRKIGWIQ